MLFLTETQSGINGQGAYAPLLFNLRLWEMEIHRYHNNIFAGKLP